jgi:hypothetical protein
MRFPTMKGVIDRRILVNYRVAPDALARLLPPPFRPQLVKGWGMAGICLIRLKGVRPGFLPAACGIGSENAAHRIAVEWDEDGSVRRGVFVRRRDTSSLLNVAAGDRIFPGEHHRATFRVEEGDGRYRVALSSADGGTRVDVRAHIATRLPAGSIFGSLAEASTFFERGALGYSPSRSGKLDGLELRCARFCVEPLAVDAVQSSFFDDPGRFPPGTVQLDCALLMREVEHEWHGRPAPRASP